MCVYGACLLFVCCNDCGNVCCVAGVIENSYFFSLGVLKYVSVGDVMDVVFLFEL